jgi:hypothetical protein
LKFVPELLKILLFFTLQTTRLVKSARTTTSEMEKGHRTAFGGVGAVWRREKNVKSNKRMGGRETRANTEKNREPNRFVTNRRVDEPNMDLEKKSFMKERAWRSRKHRKLRKHGFSSLFSAGKQPSTSLYLSILVSLQLCTGRVVKLASDEGTGLNFPFSFVVRFHTACLGLLFSLATLHRA